MSKIYLGHSVAHRLLRIIRGLNLLQRGDVFGPTVPTKGRPSGSKYERAQWPDNYYVRCSDEGLMHAQAATATFKSCN